MKEEYLSSLYKNYTGHQPDKVEQLTGSGSNRQYFRLYGEKTLIGVYGESVEENKAFIYMDRHFKSHNIPVPEIYSVSDDNKAYLQEDLGNDLLFNLIEKGRISGSFDENERNLIRKTIAALPSIQFKGAENMDFSVCYPLSEFNKRSIMWDLNYFKYCFLKPMGTEFQENHLEDDFESMADLLLHASQLPAHCATFMYRDFQSRNVIIKDGEPYFIDFQGGRKGPVYYDVASFLWQAKANFPDDLRKEMIDVYINEADKFIHKITDKSIKTDRTAFNRNLKHFVFFRTLQVLGAYGFRGLFERKKHFIESIPFAISNLRVLLENEDDFREYKHLYHVLKDMTENFSENMIGKYNKQQ